MGKPKLSPGPTAELPETGWPPGRDTQATLSRLRELGPRRRTPTPARTQSQIINQVASSGHQSPGRPACPSTLLSPWEQMSVLSRTLEPSTFPCLYPETLPGMFQSKTHPQHHLKPPVRSQGAQLLQSHLPLQPPHGATTFNFPVSTRSPWTPAQRPPPIPTQG